MHCKEYLVSSAANDPSSVRCTPLDCEDGANSEGFKRRLAVFFPWPT